MKKLIALLGFYIFSLPIMAIPVPDVNDNDIFTISGEVSAVIDDVGNYISHDPWGFNVSAGDNFYIAGIWIQCLGNRVIIHDFYYCDNQFKDMSETWLVDYNELAATTWINDNGIFRVNALSALAEIDLEPIRADGSGHGYATMFIVYQIQSILEPRIYQIQSIPEPGILAVFLLGLAILSKRCNVNR